MTVPVTQINDIPVMVTMVGGKWMYINPNKDPNQKVKYIYWGLHEGGKRHESAR